AGAMLVKEVENPRAFGVVACDVNNCVTELIEKPQNPTSNLANIGVYMLDDRVFQYEPRQHANGEYYLTDSIAQLAKHYPIIAVPALFWIPIASPEDITKAEIDHFQH
ncbi:MAG: sugar phosphate nucleotidyltransferase, partial [Nanoarchaeota archaeon]